MADALHIVCPACKTANRLRPGTAPGARVRCGRCGAEVIVPEPQASSSITGQATLAGSPDDQQVTLPLPAANAPTLTREEAEAEVSLEDALGSAGPSAARYVEQGRIGQGGMGEVVLCVDRDIRRPVAMKRMLPATAGDPARRARFIEEAQVTGQLEHPNIVPVYDLTRQRDGSVYYTMKLVRGRSLADILKDLKARQGEAAQEASRAVSPVPREKGEEPPAALSGHAARSRRDATQASLGDLLQVFLKVCDGVAFAHSRGVIHRDLKPANIMVGDYGEVLVMDWGLAKIVNRVGGRQSAVGSEDGPVGDRQTAAVHPVAGPVDESGHAAHGTRHEAVASDRQEAAALRTMEGSMMGSPGYMSPEQAKGELDKMDQRSDIFSLGAILYEILTLERAVPGDTTYAILANTLKGNIVPPEKRSPGRNIPRELSAIAMKCLSRTRARRYDSVLELRGDIALFLEGRSVSAAPDTFAQAFAKLVKRNRGVSAAVGGAAVLLIAVTTFFLINLTRQRNEAVSARATAEAERRAAQEARDRQRATALAASEEMATAALRAAEEGRMAEADFRANAAVKILPDGPWGFYSLGIIARQKNDLATARKYLDKALSFDPAHRPSNAALSELLAKGGELAKLTEMLGRLSEINDWRTLLSAGEALFSAARYQDAVRALERAVALLEKDPKVLPPFVAEKKERLLYVRAEAACVGFWESIRNLPVGEQQKRIAAKFTEIHGVAVNIEFTLENGVITGLRLDDQRVQFLQPLRDMPLRTLWCGSGYPGVSRLSDLAPLKGMPLTSLTCRRAQVRDLSPLKGMALTNLDCTSLPVSDLTPLKGMPLTSLNISHTQISDLGQLRGLPLTSLDCYGTRVSDLAPLKGMALTSLNCADTQVGDLGPLKGMPLTTLICGFGTARVGRISDLSPLRGMSLTVLNFNGSRVADLGPLKGMPLKMLDCGRTNVSDLSPLDGMQLEEFVFSPNSIKQGIEVVRGMKSIKKIAPHFGDRMWAEDFWKKYDAGEFK